MHGSPRTARSFHRLHEMELTSHALQRIVLYSLWISARRKGHMRPGALLHHALRGNRDGGTVPERHALERTAAFI